MELSPEQTRKVTERIIELGDKKELVTQEDLPYIVSDVLKHDTVEEHVRLLSYMVTTAYGLKPMAQVKLEINGEAYEENASGDGQFDAFMRAARHIYKNRLSRKSHASQLQCEYSAGWADGCFGTGRHYVELEREGISYARLDADQTEAAIKATLKMLNKIEQ